MKHNYFTQHLSIFLFICLLLSQLSVAAVSLLVPDNTIDVNASETEICLGESISISLSTSEIGVEYQLKADGVNTEAAIPGTGSSLLFNITPNSSAVYSVSASNITTLETIDLIETVNITVNTGPSLDFTMSSDKSKICQDSNEPIVISLDDSENGLNYWLRDEFGGSHGSEIGTGGKISFTSVSPNTSTVYYVETTTAGCSGYVKLNNDLAIEVTALPKADITLSVSEPDICVGENTVISLSTSEVGVSYQLFDGTYNVEDPINGTGSAISFREFSPFRSVTYQVIATNIECGSSVNLSNTIRVNVGLQPETHLHPTIDKHTICEGEQIVVSLTPTDTKVSYQLLDGDTPIGDPITGNNVEISFEPTIPNQSTTYRIEALGDKCLAPIDIRYTVDVNVHHSPKTDKMLKSDRDTVCMNEELVLSIEDSEQDMIYRLHDGTMLIESNIIGNGETIYFPVQHPDVSKTYSVYAHETVCTDPVQLNNTKLITVPDIAPFSVENFATPVEFCEGEAIDIELTNSINGIHYILCDGDDEIAELIGDGSALVFEDIVPDLNSNLEVTIGNCLSKMVAAKPDYTIQSNPQLNIISSGIKNGYDGRLVISVSEGVPPYTYIINPGETITQDSKVLELTNLEEGTYQILVVDGNACRSSEAGQLANVGVDADQKIVAGNALTPNGDGINDNWIIHYDSSLGNPEVYVFNIYGQQVYHSKAYQNDWTGSYNGSILPNGAYYYLIEFDSEGIEPIKGSLSILGN